jgi:predicted ester cyclase
MKSDPSRDLVNRMIEEIQNNKRIELCDELFAENFINHTPSPNIANDRSGMRRLFSLVHTAFPDGRIAISDQISDGSKVWTRKTFSGTHTGAFGNVPPTGKLVTYEVIDILAVEDGKMIGHWSVVDRLNLFQQLGVIR